MVLSDLYLAAPQNQNFNGPSRNVKKSMQKELFICNRYQNNKIRKPYQRSHARPTLIAGNGASRCSQMESSGPISPSGLDFDKSGNILVADMYYWPTRLGK